MKPDLVSPDFLFTFGFTFGKHTGNISISEIAISNIFKIQRIYQVIFDSSNHQRGIRVSYDMISFNFSGAFLPTLRHCYCKARRMS